jgi:hypothetical protein
MIPASSSHGDVAAVHRADEVGHELLREGFAIVRAAKPSDLIRAIAGELDELFCRTSFSCGHFYGERTKRFGGLPRRCADTQSLVIDELVLRVADMVLGHRCDGLQLNVAEAIEVHPGAPAQYPHRDADMWPRTYDGGEICLNIIWPLDAFTADNGATRIWPETHGSSQCDPSALSQPVVAIAEPGDAILILGSTLHGAGANISGGARRAVVIGYCLGWLRPYENSSLAYPPEIARTFSPELAALIGYRRHRPNLGNIDGRCPSLLLQTISADEFLGADDALLPQQEEALRTYVADQLPSSVTGAAQG